MKKEYAQNLLKKTQEDYSLIAKDFSRTRKYPWWEMKFLFSNYLDSGDKVLDLGCGNGRNLPLFKEKDVDYFGLDNCQELIEIAKENYPQERFKIGDVLDIPFPDNFFDKVYSIAVFHQIPSNEFRFKFLKEVQRVLKPKGLMILSVWRFSQKREIGLLFKYTLLKIIGKSKLDWGDIFIPWGEKLKRYYHYFSKSGLRKLVKKVGFNIIDSGIVKNETKNRQNIYIVAEKPL